MTNQSFDDIAGGAVFLSIISIFILIFSRVFWTQIVLRRWQWRQLPTLDGYLAQHPECRTAAGPKCASCGSKSLRNWGLFRADDKFREFICNSCGTRLYRSANG